MAVTPKISVIMPIYNCELYVAEAVESILNQTFADYEFIIIDDNSTDATLEIVKRYTDERIILIEKPANTGYTDSLNYGITLAKGQYIARMDGDDISFPERFKVQFEFLESYKDVILCGTGIKMIHSDKVLHHPSSHEEIKVMLCYANALFHPTVFFRKEILLENKYDKNFEPAEDYNLWTRLVFKGKIMNINETLLYYREHNQQVSKTKKNIQTDVAIRSQIKMFQILFDDELLEMQSFREAFNYETPYQIESMTKTCRFFKKAKNKNRQLKIYDVDRFNQIIRELKTTYLKNYFRCNAASLLHLKAYVMHITITDFLTIAKHKRRIKNTK